MANNKKENKNTIYNTIKSVCGILFPLISFPYISRVLTAENLGKINFAHSISSYCALIATLGVTTYAVRECAKVRDDEQKLGEVAGQILSINLTSTFIAYLLLIIILIVAKPLANYRFLIGIQSLTILFGVFGAEWLNTAMEDFKYITIRTVSMQAISLLLMFLFVKKPEHYINYALISVVSSSGANVANILYRRKYCKVKLTWKMDAKKHLPPILLMFSMIISQTIYCNSDITLLGLMRSDFEVGLYSASVKIYTLVNTLVASVAFVVMPQLTVNFAAENYAEVNRLLKYALNFIIVLGLPSLVGINVIAPQLIETLAGPEYLAAVTSLRILTVSLAFSFLGGWIGNTMMLPAGKEKICLRGCIVSAMVNIVLNLLLIPRWGLNAAAATTALSELVGILILFPHIDKNICVDGLAEMIKAPLVGAVEIVFVGMIIKLISTNSLIICGITISLSVLCYGITLMILKNEFALGFIKHLIFKRKGDL